KLVNYPLRGPFSSAMCRNWLIFSQLWVVTKKTHPFDDAAELYDEVRSRYPEETVEHIIAFAALPTQGRVFEVGCGTGQMTLPFAQRGYTVVALDQGERLAALAAQHCQPYPQVRAVPCAFEAWQDTPASYDLFLSAQAFHW